MKLVKVHKTLIVLIFAVLFSALEFLAVRAAVDSSGLRITRLTQIYALTAIVFLYATVVSLPLTVLIAKWSNNVRVRQVRRGLAIATLYFILLHVILGFFTQFGGFAGLPFLNDRYLLAVILGFTGLVMAGLIVVGEFLVTKWKFVRSRVVAVMGYALIVLVSIHALMLGNHFANVWDFIPQMFIAALAILIILQGLWIDKWLRAKYGYTLEMGPALVMSVTFVAVMVTLILAAPTLVSFNVHNDHGLARDGTGLPVPMPAMPSGNQVTKTFRDYSVTLLKPGPSKVLVMELMRQNSPAPEQVGQGKLLLVNQTTYESFTVEGTLDTTQQGKLSFQFPLAASNYAPGVYQIFAKFYLATGVLLSDFSVSID